MKYIKKFESRKTPEIGDYVICSDDINIIINNFAKSNIGKIIHIYYDVLKKYPFIVQYDNIPDDIKYIKANQFENSIAYKATEIIHCSKNKDDLSYFIETNKFNL